MPGHLFLDPSLGGLGLAASFKVPALCNSLSFWVPVTALFCQPSGPEMVTVLELLARVPAPQFGSPYTPLTHFGFNPFASKLSSNYTYPAVPSAASWAPDSTGEA